ncbi:MAG: hypothetical protein J6U10_02245 [Lachnospiraceae bacterium]|nr:hypothetical protein [Lachnospiraceae bacterium]
MVEIREVKNRRERKEFVEFPLKMYKDNPCFVPPFYGDEMKIFRKDYVYNDMCESVFFNAYRDGKIVGRISGILQRVSNEIRNEKRVRFTRFDAIDDQEVAAALFKAVEDWAVSKGMDTVCGPLGYSDLEREGLLIEGFDQVSTFEEQYNAEYYGKLIENCGYAKEVDWTECRLRYPKNDDGKLDKLADTIMKKYNLRVGPAKNVNDFIDRYAGQLFEILDKSYSKLYGTVPFTDGMIKMTIENFKLIIDLRFVAVILDENDKVVCLGVCFPSLSNALRGSGGHLYPTTLVKLLRDIKHPKSIDLGLVGVDPEWANRGISTVAMAGIMRMLKNDGIEYAETNLNLEDNTNIRNFWKRFDSVEHKRRRSYVKELKKG